jgi:hypothetical protein
MFHIDFKSDVQTMATHVNGLVVALILGNLLFNIVANASFKVSAESANWKGFLFWRGKRPNRLHSVYRNGVF